MQRQPSHEVSVRPRALHVIEDALVTPTVVDRRASTFTGCVYDHGGRIVRASQRTARDVAWQPADPEQIDSGVTADELDGDCLYLGHYTGHYGHFLLETLARFWALESTSDVDRFLLQPFVHSTPRPRSFPPARVCLECFGADLGRVSIVRKPTRVRRLMLPTSLVEIKRWADRRQRDVYRKIAACCRREHSDGQSASRLYLSRRRLRRFGPTTRSRGYRPFSNEHQVEGVFASLGFEVLHPERIDFARQVSMYEQADVVAGSPGSALHNAVFMKPGALLVKVGNLRHRSAAVTNQLLCDELGGVRSEFLPFEGRVVDSDRRLGEVDIGRLRERLEGLLGKS